MPASTRDRIVGVSAELFRRQGYLGTGVKQIVDEAGAPFGSVYHFFPGGKEELGAEAIIESGRQYGLLGAAVFGPAPDVVTGVRDFFAGAAEDLEASDYADACPIAMVALEVSSVSKPMREACAEVFEGWIAGLTAIFADAGIPQRRSRELAISMLAGLEGAFVLCRAARSTEALEIAGRTAVAEVRAALAKAQKASGGAASKRSGGSRAGSNARRRR